MSDREPRRRGVDRTVRLPPLKTTASSLTLTPAEPTPHDADAARRRRTKPSRRSKGESASGRRSAASSIVTLPSLKRPEDRPFEKPTTTHLYRPNGTRDRKTEDSLASVTLPRIVTGRPARSIVEKSSVTEGLRGICLEFASIDDSEDKENRAPEARKEYVKPIESRGVYRKRTTASSNAGRTPGPVLDSSLSGGILGGIGLQNSLLSPIHHSLRGVAHFSSAGGEESSTSDSEEEGHDCGSDGDSFRGTDEVVGEELRVYRESVKEDEDYSYESEEDEEVEEYCDELSSSCSSSTSSDDSDEEEESLVSFSEEECEETMTDTDADGSIESSHDRSYSAISGNDAPMPQTPLNSHSDMTQIESSLHHLNLSLHLSTSICEVNDSAATDAVAEIVGTGSPLPFEDTESSSYETDYIESGSDTGNRSDPPPKHCRNSKRDRRYSTDSDHESMKERPAASFIVPELHHDDDTSAPTILPPSYQTPTTASTLSTAPDPAMDDTGHGPSFPIRSPDGKHLATVSRREKVKPGQWSLGSQIGRGSFGVVHVGMNKITGNLMAVKSLHVGSASPEYRDDKISAILVDIQREIDLMRSLSHPNIVRYFGAEASDGHLRIFCEWVPGGSVSHLLRKFGPFSVSVVRSYGRQILRGLVYLHSRSVMHRDVKGGNVLVGEDGTVKLADFGASKQLERLDKNPNAMGGSVGDSSLMASMTMKGTPYFMAPEVFEGRYNYKADVWSVGGVILQMLTCKPPWKNLGFSSPMSLFFHLKSTDSLPTLPEELDLSPSLERVIRSCFARDPVNRPSSRKLLHESFFQEEEYDPSNSEDETVVHGGGRRARNRYNAKSPKLPTPRIDVASAFRSENRFSKRASGSSRPDVAQDPGRKSYEMNYEQSCDASLNGGTGTVPDEIISILPDSEGEIPSTAFKQEEEAIVISEEWPSWARQRAGVINEDKGEVRPRSIDPPNDDRRNDRPKINPFARVRNGTGKKEVKVQETPSGLIIHSPTRT